MEIKQSEETNVKEIEKAVSTPNTFSEVVRRHSIMATSEIPFMMQLNTSNLPESLPEEYESEEASDSNWFKSA